LSFGAPREESAPLSVEPQENVRSFGVIGSCFLRTEYGEPAFLQDADQGRVVCRHTGLKRARLFQAQESGDGSVAMPRPQSARSIQ
jgi:hypothetical protein